MEAALVHRVDFISVIFVTQMGLKFLLLEFFGSLCLRFHLVFVCCY